MGCMYAIYMLHRDMALRKPRVHVGSKYSVLLANVKGDLHV